MIARIFLSVMLAGSVSAALGAPPANHHGPCGAHHRLYAVTGSSPHEIWHAITRARPWKTNHNYSATTTWVARSQYRFDAGEDGFRLVKFHEETKVTVTLPRWAPPRMPPGNGAAVDKAVNALALHESGHVAIACQVTGELMREMGKLGSFASRQEMRDAARDTENRVLARYRARDRDYDLETRHGAFQGARW